MAAKKLPSKLPMRTPAHGRGQLRIGGSNGGAGGRPPDEFKARMRELASLAEQQGYVEAVLKDPTHPHWMRALEYVTERGYGKAPQTVEVTGEGGGAVKTELTIRWGGLEVPL